MALSTLPLRAFGAAAILAAIGGAAPQQQAPADEFAQSIRPVLTRNCASCHTARSRMNFLKAENAKGIEANRGLWRSVAAQLRNRTMPPVESKLTEEERLRTVVWVEDYLRKTACSAGEFAGAPALRRLNRREYRNTVRDLLGVDYNVSELFPNDGTGGAGFDTNGETLYVPPLLMERYLEAAQQIVDRAVITPPLSRTFAIGQMLPAAAQPAVGQRELGPGQETSVPISIYLDDEYDVRVPVNRKDGMGSLALKIDGGTAVPLAAVQTGRGQGKGGRGAAAVPQLGVRVRIARGLRQLSIVAEGSPVTISGLTVQQKIVDPSPEKLAAHYRLLGAEPGSEPLQPRRAAEQILRGLLRKAYRRPVEAADVTPLLALYDRGAERGDPFEERIKLALKAVLVSPNFLFKMEQRSAKPGIYPLGQYELASRLSYFLWSTMPDDELMTLAALGKLQDPQVLTAQVDRMLDDPKARTFTRTFIGQWLGTQDLGGRLAPMLTELQAFYTPPVAADLRAEPVLIFERILGENRSLMELLNGNYTYMTERLVKFYQLEDQLRDVHGNEPQLVE